MSELGSDYHTNELLRDESAEEIADILEVIDAICVAKGFEKSAIEKIKEEKLNKKGGFEKKIILEES